MTDVGRGLLVVLILLSAGLAGCNNAEVPEPEEPAAVEPPREARILAVWDGPAAACPLVNWPEVGVIGSLVYGTLFRLDDEMALEPHLAEEVVVEGDLVTLRLRPDLLWHDGREVTAADVEFTLHTLLDPEFTGADPGLEFDFISGARQYRTGEADRIEGIRVEDETTLHLSVAAGAGLWNLYFLSPVPRHLFDEVPAGEMEDALRREPPVGCGPFWVEEARETDAGVQLELVQFLDFPLEGGDLERATVLICSQMPPEEELDFDVIVASGLLNPPVPAGFTVRRVAGGGFEYLGLNLRNPVLGQAGVRQAIALAVDRERVAEDLFGEHARKVDSPLPWAAEEEVARRERDPEAAQTILAEAGFARGDDGWLRTPEEELVRLYLGYPAGDTRRKMAAEGIAADLAEIGIRADPVGIDRDLLLYNLYVRNRFDMYLLAMPWRMSSCPTTWGDGNIWGWAGLESETEEWVLRVTEDLPIIPLAQPETIVMISADLNPALSWNVPILGDLFLWTWGSEAGN
ncbi:MAG: ABC transporter substrate-binding protein [Bacillota bacterium]